MTAWQALWRVFRFRPGICVLSLLTWGIFKVLSLFPALLIKGIFDALSSSAPASANLAWSLLALFIAAIIGRVSFSAAGVATEIALTQSVSALLRSTLFESQLRTPQANSSSGEKISRFRDDVQSLMDFVDNASLVVGQLAYGIIALSIMVRINLLVTLVVFLPLMVVVIIINRLGSVLQKYRRASRAATGEITGFLGSLFGIVQAVRLAGAEAAMLARFQDLNERRRVSGVKERVLGAGIGAFEEYTINLGIGLVLLLAAQAMRAKTFSVGDLALFTESMWWITRLPAWCGDFLTQGKQVEVSLTRLGALLPEQEREQLAQPRPISLHGPLPVLPEPTVLSPTERLQTLEVRGLTYRHTGSGRGIEDINLSIKRGSFTVITGRIGSGKTTLLRVLLGLLPRQAGEILWNGEPVDDPARFFVPPRSAYTSQVPQLFSETLRANILMGLPEERVALSQALYLAALEHDLEELEHGLETPLGSKGTRLSGGQAQRVAAARMFVRGSELLVCDDLSSALDGETERQLWQRLSQQPEVTCLAVSHRPSVLQRADQIIVLRSGKIIAAGTLDEVRKFM